MILVVPKISLPTWKSYLKRKFQPNTFPTPGKSSKPRTSREGYKIKKICFVRMKLNLGLLILHCLQLSTTALHSQVCLPKHCRPVEIKSHLFKLLTPKIWLLILPSSCYTFPCKKVMRIWCQIEISTSTW